MADMDAGLTREEAIRKASRQLADAIDAEILEKVYREIYQAAPELTH